MSAFSKETDLSPHSTGEGAFRRPRDEQPALQNAWMKNLSVSQTGGGPVSIVLGVIALRTIWFCGDHVWRYCREPRWIAGRDLAGQKRSRRRRTCARLVACDLGRIARGTASGTLPPTADGDRHACL